MKVYIVHGWEGSPNEPMFQWLKHSLEARDYDVVIPAMPETKAPKIDAWVGKLANMITPDENTILVGHSIGCQAILRYLQSLPSDKGVRGAVFIAPWMKLDKKTMKEEGKGAQQIAKPWIETPIDFEKIKNSLGKVVAIFSDNDSYVPLDEKVVFETELGAEIIVEKKKGHFTAADKVNILPSALSAIISI